LPVSICSSLSKACLLAAMAVALLPGPRWLMAQDDYREARELFWSGNYDECTRQCREALQFGSDAEDWFELLLECSLATGKVIDAAELAETAMLSSPNSIRILWLARQTARLVGDDLAAQEIMMELEDRIRYRSWRYRDVPSRIVQASVAIDARIDAKLVLDELLTPARLMAPGDHRVWLAIGELALAKNDYAMAADNFRKAVELEPADPAGHIGLAQAFRSSDPQMANEALNKALELNARSVAALLHLIDDRINAEQYEEAGSLIEQVISVNPIESSAWSYATVIAHLNNDPDREKDCREKALGRWLSNPQVDHLIGKKLSQKYRFAEGASCQRRALICDPDYLPAKIQLANDLLRLGNDEEGWKLAREVYESDSYNVVAYNLVTLGDEMEKFSVIDRDGFIVRMDPRESQLFGDRVVEILIKARKKLSEKYQMEVARPVFIEIFPQQKDFAIRTFGLPGGQGFLGVCFGNVITMNSPTSRAAGNTNWESVLWHEFCHVVTLQKTGNKMPRWLSEGISVYEELQEDPAWGQVMTPRYRSMILDGELTPVSKLSSAFLSPKGPEYLQFAYYESALAVKFLIERHGLETFRLMLDDLGTGMPVNDVLGRRTGGIELLDKEFAEFARKLAEETGKGLDWTKPEPGQIATVSDCRSWNTQHPDNWFGLRAEAALLLQDEKFDEAEPLVKRLAELWPEYRADDNAWALLAMIARSRGDVETEIEMLFKSISVNAADMASFRRLLPLLAERKRWDEVTTIAGKSMAIDPIDRGACEVLATACGEKGDFSGAARVLGQLTLLDPVDPAGTRLRYAVALKNTGDRKKARRQLLECLEEAPRYEDAHRLLLELTAENDDVDTPEGPATRR
jgi:tetratricopeptide (TPR) repeat protein